MKTITDIETDASLTVKFFDVNNETPITLSPYMIMNLSIGTKCLKENAISYNNKGYYVKRKAYKVIDGEGQYHVWLEEFSNKNNTTPSKTTNPTDNSIATSTFAIPDFPYLELSERSGTQTGYPAILVFPTGAPDFPYSLNIGDTGNFTSYLYPIYGTVIIHSVLYQITGALTYEMTIIGYTGASPTSQM